ncbi:MAG TPA: efflux RND transporter periplasmic adaptor subunit [Anaerolineales bacterium]|nr:efflux RND transporter periplasmic adaptor subunit [Anaerolineales bacterium]
MKHKHYLPFLVLVLVIVAAGAWWIRAGAASDKSSAAMEATGTIEARQTALSSEIGGKIIKVLVDEGQLVKAGDPVVILDDSLLAAQRKVAQSGMDSARSALLTAQSGSDLAQAQYDAELTAARAQEGSQRLADWSKRTPNWFEQPLWYFGREEQITAAQAEVDAARQALQQAQAELERVIKNVTNADFVAAETRLSNARTRYLVAKSVDSHAQITGGKVRPEDVDVKLPAWFPATYRAKIAIAKDMSGESDILNVSQDNLDAAKTELDEAEKGYDDLLTSEAADRVLKARAEVSVAQERYEVALDTLNRLKMGEYSPQVKIAEMALEQSKNAVKQAQNAVSQAEANLSLLDTQIAKLTIYAPTDGVVLTRNAEVGQMALPGATLIELGRLDQLELTVYLPEETFGLIVPNQAVQARVDAYPGRVFSGTVLRMANEAEFTPTNVQTKEDRTRLVYAVVIRLDNPELILKPGMIADVDFTVKK